MFDFWTENEKDLRKQEKQQIEYSMRIFDEWSQCKHEIKEKYFEYLDKTAEQIEQELIERKNSIPRISFLDSSLPPTKKVALNSINNSKRNLVNLNLSTSAIYYGRLTSAMNKNEEIHGRYWFGDNEKDCIKFKGIIASINYVRLDGVMQFSINGEIIK